jgi:hypothetical protein
MMEARSKSFDHGTPGGFAIAIAALLSLAFLAAGPAAAQNAPTAEEVRLLEFGRNLQEQGGMSVLS